MRTFRNPVFLIFLALMLYQSLRSGTFSSPMDWLMDTLLYIPAVIIGIAFHEFAHGWTAYKLGDNTPKIQGRVTINPAAHIDPIGLVALIFAHFGWGKPVMINPDNFKHRRRDEFLVAIAGVMMNLIVAVVFTFVMKVIVAANPTVQTNGLTDIFLTMIQYIVVINLVLMIFNLIPVPPLDGFNIITEIFNLRHTRFYSVVYDNGFFILMALIIFGITGRIISPAVSACYTFLVKLIL